MWNAGGLGAESHGPRYANDENAEEEQGLEVGVRAFEQWLRKCVKGDLWWSKTGRARVSHSTRHYFTLGAPVPLGGFPWLLGLRRSPRDGWQLRLPSAFKPSRFSWGHAARAGDKYSCHLNFFMASSLICWFWPISLSDSDHHPFSSGFSYIILVST